MKRARRAPGARSTRARRFGFLPETRSIREADWTVAPVPADLQDRRVEITGPDRAQDGHQRAQLRRVHLHGGLRGLAHAHVGQHDPAARSTCATRSTAPSRFKSPEGKCYKLNEKTATLHRAPARLAPARAPRAGRRRAGVGVALRLRPLLLPQRRAPASRKGSGPVLLPAEDREPPRGAPLERRLQRGRDAHGPAARHHQGDGADRDAARRLRDGRDPLRAARPLGGPQLRALGLHLQLHQEAAQRTTSCSPTARRSR